MTIQINKDYSQMSTKMQFSESAQILQPSWHFTEDFIHIGPLKETKLVT